MNSGKLPVVISGFKNGDFLRVVYVSYLCALKTGSTIPYM